MEPKLWIKKMFFNDGSIIEFNSNDIIVIVGPNNSGKSAILKEASGLLANSSIDHVVLNKIEYQSEGTLKDLEEYLNDKSFKNNESGIPNYSGIGYRVGSVTMSVWWKEKLKGVSDLARVFSLNLTTEERLRAANPPKNIKILSEPPNHPIHIIQKNESLENKINDYFKQAFNLDLVVFRNGGSEVPLFVGKKPSIGKTEDRLSISYQTKIEKELVLLHRQGDGIRSFAGILLNVFVGEKNLLFIDEPEAFLHPPQSRFLGKMLTKDVSLEKQLFLSTHSLDFLKGLIEGDSKRLKIIRVQRDGNVNYVNTLDNKDIEAIWSDSLLRYSNILDGLFHKEVIICESDSDCRFYSAVLSSIMEAKEESVPDTLFVHCGGKHRIPMVIKALKKLNVPVKAICDFDVLNDENPLRKIFEEAGGDWDDIKIEFKSVKSAIDSKKPDLEAEDLKKDILEILDSTVGKSVSPQDLKKISNLLRKSSPWSLAKQMGKLFVPSGNPTRDYSSLVQKLNERGIFIVEVGELESFVKSVGNHGPKWVNEVLEKDLCADPELREVREFVLKVNDIKF